MQETQPQKISVHASNKIPMASKDCLAFRPTSHSLDRLLQLPLPWFMPDRHTIRCVLCNLLIPFFPLLFRHRKKRPPTNGDYGIKYSFHNM